MAAQNPDSPWMGTPSRASFVASSRPPGLDSSDTASSRSCSGSSVNSTASSYSNMSSESRGSTASRRRGYVRPQGGSFADSARNRESVMSLGSIAHLQYYFARTGLLDGKGGQMAKKKQDGQYDIPKHLAPAAAEAVESPIEDEGQAMWEASLQDGADVMLPPTVSTYSDRSIHVAPPPDPKTMKTELVEGLENALHALEACERTAHDDAGEEHTQGFYELEGLHVLDTVTEAIRAARIYYTLHPNPARLNSIRSDQQLRRDLHAVLDVLKRCAARNFAGGLREDERLAVLVWVSDVGMMIDQEAKLDEADKRERKEWSWLDDARWIGREDDRDWEFVRSLLKEPGPGTAAAHGDGRTLDGFRRFADGKDLIRLHNAAVNQSKKRFDYISQVHEDVSKPYRRAENLRFWLKAAELRWELRLPLDVMAVANPIDNAATWAAFDVVVRRWCRGVRAELIRDWMDEGDRRLHARARSLAQASPLSSPARGSPPASAVASPSRKLTGAIPAHIASQPPVPMRLPVPSTQRSMGPASDDVF